MTNSMPYANNHASTKWRQSQQGSSIRPRRAWNWSKSTPSLVKYCDSLVIACLSSKEPFKSLRGPIERPFNSTRTKTLHALACKAHLYRIWWLLSKNHKIFAHTTERLEELQVGWRPVNRCIPHWKDLAFSLESLAFVSDCSIVWQRDVSLYTILNRGILQYLSAVPNMLEEWCRTFMDGSETWRLSIRRSCNKTLLMCAWEVPTPSIRTRSPDRAWPICCWSAFSTCIIHAFDYCLLAQICYIPAHNPL